jgi:FAD-dependent urate hydroxylase
VTTPITMLIVGAGPFGLSLASYAEYFGIDYRIVGQPMGFWKANMPKGMFLRSASDWHLDPMNRDTIERYLETLHLTPADVEPLSLDFYLDYTQWFQDQQGIRSQPSRVVSLDRIDGEQNLFSATMQDGEILRARNVALALGFEYFKHIPEPIAAMFPASHLSHTCDHVNFTDLQGKRCLILGGRQSAFEWAALLHEAGVDAVHVSHRHPSPSYTEADWKWVPPLLENMVSDPGWFRNLPEDEQRAVSRRLWGEGRLKVEPWLKDRIEKGPVTIWPETQVTGCDIEPDDSLRVHLDNGETLAVDHVICATGYKVQVDRIPFLAAGNIFPDLRIRNGFPELDLQFQSSVPGLYFTSMPAGQDFGPFFGFTVAVRTSALVIGQSIRQSGGGQAPEAPETRPAA